LYHAFAVSHHTIKVEVQVGFSEFVKGVLSSNQGLQELQGQREQMMVLGQPLNYLLKA